MNLADSCAFITLTKAAARTNKKATLFIYDNSKLPQPIADIDPWDIIYKHDSLNRGVGCAYNEAFREAKKRELDWLLLADQDTSFPSLIYWKYEQSIDFYTTSSLFAPNLLDKKGFISPFQRGLTSGRRIKELLLGSRSLKRYHVINSGLLIKCKLFELAGGYEEKLRLDFSDFYFLKKVEKHTDQIVFINSECLHNHSSNTKNKSLALERFKIYLESTRVLSTEPNGYAFTLRAFGRAVKLSFLHRSFQFINTYLSN